MEEIRHEREYKARQIFRGPVEFLGSVLGANGYRSYGNEYYLDPVNGNNGWNGKDRRHPKKTLPEAYVLLKANQNDVLYVSGGATALSLSAAFDWSKNYTHMIGLTPHLHNGGRVRISHSDNFTPFFTISARACGFYGIHWQHGRGNAGNLVGVSCTYSGNAALLFDGCDFEGPLHATEAAAAFKTVNLASGCADVTFRNSRFGQWTVEADLSSGNLLFLAGLNSIVTVDDCTFMAPSTSANFAFVNAAANQNGANALLLFKKTRFIQLYRGATLTKAVVEPTSAQGNVVFDNNCIKVGVTDYATAAATSVFVTSPAANEAGGTGTNPA